MSDLSFTRVDIKRVIYKEGHMEPAVKRPLIIINKDGKPVETDVEIANPTLVALTKDADDLAVIIREVNGSQGIFGANTALVTFILCTLIFIASVGGAYFGYQTYKRLEIIANAQGINLNPQPVPITPTPKAK
jgi:hypothetical protein